MKKIISLIIIILLLPTIILSQEILEVKVSDTYILTGAIDDKYEITMYLTLDSALIELKADGKYYYNSSKKYIDIDGYMTKIQGRNDIIALDLEEKVYNNKNDKYEITGNFIGAFDKKNITFSGNWINPKTKKKLPFELTADTNLATSHIENYKISYESENTSRYRNLVIDFTYPKLIGSSAAIKKINDLEKRTKSNIESANESYEYAYEKDGNYGIGEDTELVYIDERIACFVVDEMLFLAGAYPNNSTDTIVYNIKTGKEVDTTLSNLFVNANDKKLKALLKKKLEKLGSPDYNVAKLENVGLIDNYYIDVDGVHFIYSQGQYLAHVMGMVEVVFTFDELKPFVKRNSLFYYLFE